MKIFAIIATFLSLTASYAFAGSIPFIVIDKALVANKLMPVGTEVKVKVVQISDQFLSKLDIVCFDESPFKANEPGTAGIISKQWLSQNIKVGDVVRYTTTRRGFIGFSAGQDYRSNTVDNIDDGYRLTMDYNKHRWVIEVSFPDYD